MGENKITEKLSNLNNMKTFTLNERFNYKNAIKLLHSDLLDEEHKGGLSKYLSKCKEGKVEVEYIQNDIGRLNIKVKSLKEGETCIAQPYMKGVIKSALCKDGYVDLDMVNAHPTFLEQILKDKGLECPALSYLNENRDKFFKKMEKKGLSRDNCKVLILVIFYNGTIKSFCKDNKLNEEDIPDFIYALDKEIKKNNQTLLNTNELLKYRMKAIENKENSPYPNIDGTAMSYYLQTIECKCLMVVYDYLKSKKYTIGALIHDGLHLKKIDEDYDYEPLCNELNKELIDKTGIDIQFKIKEFRDLPELDDIHIITTDKEGADIISDKLKNDYIVSHERIFMRVDNVWTENDKVIKRNLIKEVGNMTILMDKGGNINPYSTMARSCMNMLQFVEPTEDPDFIDKLWTSNLFKLCFKNGYYDFKQGKVVDYDNDTHTTIKINRDYQEPTDENIKLVYQKIFNPIFNNDKELMECWLNYIARGLAGHIEDKNWGVGIGERDCGKGVLGGMLENCFGEYCRATNSENFLFKNNGGDSAKALSWLVPFEFKRLLLTNEITRDAEGKVRINGNILKKLSSGGDKIEARVNHKDEINFKIQARVCMFCNDLPPIEPADAKETSLIFRYPSKFLNEDDDRLGKPLMRQKYKLGKDDKIEYENVEKECIAIPNPDSPMDCLKRIWIPVDEATPEDFEKEVQREKNHLCPVMENICNFYKKDDDIKFWSKKPEIMNAFIHIIFSHYGKKMIIPETMKEEMNDFKDDEKEEDRFIDLFNFMGDKEWDNGKKDWVSISQINVLLKKASINLSAQKYKNYLLSKGAVKGKRLNEQTNKRENCWICLQVNDYKVKQIANGGYALDSEDEDE
jgi:hypothetical protein